MRMHGRSCAQFREAAQASQLDWNGAVEGVVSHVEDLQLCQPCKLRRDGANNLLGGCVNLRHEAGSVADDAHIGEACAVV